MKTGGAIEGAGRDDRGERGESPAAGTGVDVGVERVGDESRAVAGVLTAPVTGDTMATLSMEASPCPSALTAREPTKVAVPRGVAAAVLPTCCVTTAAVPVNVAFQGPEDGGWAAKLLPAEEKDATDAALATMLTKDPVVLATRATWLLPSGP